MHYGRLLQSLIEKTERYPALQKQTESGSVPHDQTDQREHRRFGEQVEAAKVASGHIVVEF